MDLPPEPGFHSLPRDSSVQQQTLLLGLSFPFSPGFLFSVQDRHTGAYTSLEALQTRDLGGKAFASPTSLLLGNAEQLSHHFCV